MNNRTETFMAILLVLGLLIFAIMQINNENVIDAPKGDYYGTQSDTYFP